MLHETGDRDAIQARLAVGDRSERSPITPEQPTCNPVSPEQANDAEGNSRERNAHEEGYA